MSRLVISDIDETLITRLKQSAAARGVSPDEEVKNILDRWLPPTRTMSKEKALALLDQRRAADAHLQTSDSVDLIREDRNR